MTSVIVDACIARASGGAHAKHPTASITREFLEAMRKAKRPIGYSPELAAEWKKHRSNFSAKWLAAMYARKLVDVIHPDEQVGFRAKVKNCGCTPDQETLMGKDFHLLDASYQTNGPVASLDNAARQCFSTYYDAIGIRPGVHWINPLEENADGFNWIRSETENSPTRRLSDYKEA